MKATRDYYDLLEIPRTATADEVRAAHRKLARRHHPDINKDPGSSDRLKEINLAFDVLADPEKRARYDRFGADYERYQNAPPEEAFNGQQPFTYRTTTTDGGASFSGMHDADVGSMFESLFGNAGSGQRRGRGGRPRARRGDDVEHRVSLTLDEAFTGTTRTFEMKLDEQCSDCKGVGATRNGTCPTCAGSGTVPRRTRIEVTIPVGVKEGQRVRIAGKGQPGVNGGEPGDVFLIVHLEDHPAFALEGDDVRTRVDVPMTTALLGGEIVVRTLTGRIALTIPPETQPGKTFRLRGQGWPRAKNGRGDLLAEVGITLPTNLSPRERELIEELRAIRDSTAA